jgi:V/A-type H+/Na+-transporting ATPase subunit C
VESLHYAQAVARIRVLETRLLDRSFLDRLIDSDQLENALKLLQDKGYSDRFSSLAAPEAFEEALNETLADAYREVDALSPEPEVTSLMALKYDYHHLKVLMKSALSEYDSEPLWLSMGTLSVQKIKRDLLAEDLRDFPAIMRTAIETVQAKLEQSNDPLWIDLLLDRACCHHMVTISASIDSPLVDTYVQRKIDLINLLTWMRCQHSPAGRDQLLETWIDGGLLDRDLLLKTLHEPIDTLIQKLVHTDYLPLLRKCSETVQGSARMVCVEKLGDEFVLAALEPARRISFGPEPLLAYLAAKETEIRNLRILLLGLQSHLEPERIRERLRMPYV